MHMHGGGLGLGRRGDLPRRGSTGERPILGLSLPTMEVSTTAGASSLRGRRNNCRDTHYASQPSLQSVLVVKCKSSCNNYLVHFQSISARVMGVGWGIM